MKCQTCVNNGGKSTLTLVHNYCYKTPAKFDEDGKRIDNGYHQICIWKCSSGHDMYTQGYDHEGYTVITQNEFERQVAIDPSTRLHYISNFKNLGRPGRKTDTVYVDGALKNAPENP
jgi:hypothetical protein